MEGLERLRGIVRDAGNIVFFGGAGVSTESGIPDFRSAGGLFSQAYAYPAEVMLSHDFFMSNPDEFFRFYREKMLYPDANPGSAHRALARLEREGKLSAVITQNIDGLHSLAGSENVLELHGSALRNYCMDCGGKYPLENILRSAGIPRCGCGGIIRPEVVLYGERLPEGVFQRAEAAVKAAEILIVGGTSLNVYPAAGLVNCFAGRTLVLINKSETPFDGRADLIIRGGIGEALEYAS